MSLSSVFANLHLWIYLCDSISVQQVLGFLYVNRQFNSLTRQLQPRAYVTKRIKSVFERQCPRNEKLFFQGYGLYCILSGRDDLRFTRCPYKPKYSLFQSFLSRYRHCYSLSIPHVYDLVHNQIQTENANDIVYWCIHKEMHDWCWINGLIVRSFSLSPDSSCFDMFIHNRYIDTWLSPQAVYLLLGSWTNSYLLSKIRRLLESRIKRYLWHWSVRKDKALKRLDKVNRLYASHCLL